MEKRYGWNCFHTIWVNMFIPLSFSPDGKYILSTSQDALVRLWRASDGHLEQAFFQVQGDIKTPAVFSPDGKQFIYPDNCRIIFRSTADGSLQQVFPQEICAVRSLAISPDGKYLATTAQNGQNLQLWDLTSGEQTASLYDSQAAISSLAFSPLQGVWLAAGTYTSQVSLWQITEKGPANTPFTFIVEQVESGQNCPVSDLVFSAATV